MVDSLDPKPLPTTGNDKITGSGSGEILSGYDGNDQLFGSGGDDLFQEGQHIWVSSTGGFKAGTSYDLGKGNDTFDGGGGYDLLSVGGTTRAAVLNLTAGTLTRGTEVDTFKNVELFELGDGADKVVGVVDEVLIATGGGMDTVVGLSSNSYLDGGDGIDLLDLSSETAKITIVETEGDGSLPSSKGTYIYGFEQIYGALNAANVVTASAGADTVVGGTKADSLSGSQGDDQLTGGDGNDLLDGGLDDDQLYGGSGNDTLRGVDDGDTIYGGAGSDSILGGLGKNLIYGGDGVNTYETNQGDDTIYGGSGAETFSVGPGAFPDYCQAEIYAGGGNDTLLGHYGDMIVSLDNGNDVGTLYDGKLYGGSGTDKLTSYGQNVLLDGGDGADTLTADAADLVKEYGGAGDDILVFKDQNTLQTSYGYGGGGNDTFNVTGNGSTRLILIGDAGNTTFTFASEVSGTATLYGGTGQSTVVSKGMVSVSFYGGDLADSLVIGDPQERMSQEAAIVKLGDGNDTLQGHLVVGSFEGGGGNDSMTVIADETGNVTVNGGSGNDTISTSGGNVYGGTGLDLLIMTGWANVDGGDGADVILADWSDNWSDFSTSGEIHGGAGNDTLQIGTGAFVLVAPGMAATSHGGIAILDVETITFVGGNTVIIDEGGQDLALGDGNDGIVAYVPGHVYKLESGNDSGEVYADQVVVYGGADGDYLIVGDGLHATLFGDAGGDNVYGGASSTLYGGGDTDLMQTTSFGFAYGGDGNDTLYGGGDGVALYGDAGNDLISGYSFGVWTDGANTISAGDGGDTLMADGTHGTADMGGGNDLTVLIASRFAEDVFDFTLKLGSGADTVQIQNGATGTVTISDFNAAVDVLSMTKVDSLADINRATETSTGVTLVEGKLTLILNGITLADLTDAVFVPL